MAKKNRRWLVLGVAVVLMLCLAVFAMAEGGEEEYQSRMFGTAWSLVPPVIAIALALITKEVYLSLFIGILTGALFYANFSPVLTATSIVDGFIGSVADGWNAGILMFLVVLGIIVALMNKAGGSAAYGEWAGKRIHSKRGAQMATLGLGVLIFVDDYFNCLTVGSVMAPVTDKHKISRAKLAYLIDATAAPVCIIAPISSWAAAVTSSADGAVIDYEINGFTMFMQAIPYNLYAILTLVMIVAITMMKLDFGSMRKMEKMAEAGDLFGGTGNEYAGEAQQKRNSKGRVLDLVLPIVVLIVSCVVGMIYTGGFFSGASFVDAFADSDASVGLALGSLVALVFIFFLYVPRKVLTFREFADSLPEGFRQMVPAILILVFAWTLSGFCTGSLGAAEFVKSVLRPEGMLAALLPVVVFLIALGIAFATGTSWGTMAILVPIILSIFSGVNESLILCVSACLGGAVCGDHISPISDTTIMASTGAQCNHIQHVSTQIPYVLPVVGASLAGYLFAGLLMMLKITPHWYFVLPFGIVITLGVLLIIRALQKQRTA